MIDRGFVKWQPFSSVTPLKDIAREQESEKHQEKPVLFPEEVSLLAEKIMGAYYSKDLIFTTNYEVGKIKEIRATIKKINPNSKTIELGCRKILFFKQILHIS